MKKRYIDRLTKPESSEEEQESVLRNLVQAQLNEENRSKWTEQLRKEGIVRDQAIKRSWWRLPVLVAFVTVLLAGIALWRWQQSYTPATLAAEYIREGAPFRLPEWALGNSSQDAKRAAALQAYNEQNYAGAIALMKSIAPNDRTIRQDVLLTGMCYFYTGDYGQAIPLLEQAKQRNEMLEVQINWLLALAYIRSGDNVRARPLLQWLSTNKESGHADRAKVLLERLDR